jgi:Zn-dependent M28 family amino/carboxypeptidase
MPYMSALIDMKETVRRLIDHLSMLTVTIGERSMFSPRKLDDTASYIESTYRGIGLEVELEPFSCNGFTASNVIGVSRPSGSAPRLYLIGAHYDSAFGTVGADDNASAVAVQMEVARQLHEIRRGKEVPVQVKFVSFALEEYPAYAISPMGSRVHAKGMKARKEDLDGMICLEMVGYCCHLPGSQKLPFPLKFMGYPRQGDFIAIVGNHRSKVLMRNIYTSFARNPDLPAQTLRVPFNGWILPAVRRSDHASFWNEGFAAVMVTDSSFFRNPNYHLPCDTMATLDLEFMARVVESLLIFLLSG